MGFVSEFKEFAVKGNVADMAVGIIIGSAFGKIVTSLVGDIVMPLVGKATGRVSFTDKFIVLGDGSFPSLAAAKEAGAAVVAYGAFIQSVIDFVIIALCIFTMIKWMNKLKKQEEVKEEKAAEPPEDVLLLRQIRDALKGKKRHSAAKPASS